MKVSSIAAFGSKFEKLVVDILCSSRGYLRIDMQKRFHSGIDELLRNEDDKVIAVQCKFFRSHYTPHSTLFRAYSKFQDAISDDSIDSGIFATSMELPSVWAQKFGVSLGKPVEIIGIQQLLTEAAPEQAQNLLDLMRVSRLESAEQAHGSLHESVRAVYANLSSPRSPDEANIDRLIREIRACPSGTEYADKYERLCEAAIKELFESELGVFNRQHSVAGGFHRLDLIASLKPSTDFWMNLQSDFRTRYVVFEFKNHEKQISQDQIYSTEKYLFTNALRSVAFIIAKNGEDKGAILARQGSLREMGKLIMTLSDDDIIEMLTMKKNADDYNVVLAAKLDHMLTTLTR